MTLEGLQLWEEEGTESIPDDQTKPSLAVGPASNGSNFIFISCVGNKRDETEVRILLVIEN